MMGGIVTDLEGRSTVAGLYAVGESACTGLHGANRLASNSLSECFVFARRAARRALGEPAPATASARSCERSRALRAPPRGEADTRAALWRDAGVERDREGLERLRARPAPAGTADRGVRARAQGEPRGAPAHRTTPSATPVADHRHVVVRRRRAVHGRRGSETGTLDAH